MKKILLAAFLFATYAASGQTIVDRSSSPSIIARDQRLFVQLSLRIPVYADTASANTNIGKDSLGLIIQIRSTGVQYKRDTTAGGHKWSIIGGAGGDVSSVFGRTGDVVATEVDYSAYYPLLSGSYDNPTWLNSLPASKISSAGNVTAASSKITLGGTPSGAGLQNFSIDVNQANLSLSSIGGLLNVNQINATGTPSGSTVLYGDGSWGAAGGGGGGGTNLNVGTGYRWAIPGTNNIKTHFVRGYLVDDSSSNTNGITTYADTSAGKLATKTDLLGYINKTSDTSQWHTFNYLNTIYFRLQDSVARGLRSTGWNDLRYLRLQDTSFYGIHGEDYLKLLFAPIAAGLPPGGTTGQVPIKNSSSDYDVSWGNQSGGGSGIDSIQYVTSGSSVTVTDGYNRLVVNPSTALSALAITLPATAHYSNKSLRVVFGDKTNITIGTVVTTLSFVGNTGQSIVGDTPFTAISGDVIDLWEDVTNNTWYLKKL